MRVRSIIISAAMAVLAPAAASAQEARQVPASVGAVVKCRAEADEAARLRCYDGAATALDQAVRSGALVALDKEAVRKTRRSLFGFDVNLPFFGGDKDEDEPEEAKEVVATVQSARAAGFENWLLALDTGALWQTTEATPKLGMPRPGDKITIRKSVAGGYMLHFSQRRIRIKRVR